jgi:hypothetical protein
MLPTERLQQHINDVADIMNENKRLKADVAFYERVLVQAVLTNDGVLKIDPAKFEEAVSTNHSLEFGSKGVVLHGSKYSLWPGCLDKA